MQQLPSIRAARAIAAAQLAVEATDPALAECLGAIGGLIERTGDPVRVIDWVLSAVSREDLQLLAVQQGITLHESNADEQPVTTFVIWTATGGMAIVPHDQHPTDTLVQLRAAIAERQEEELLSAAFQASVAAGHVEDLVNSTATAWKAQ